MAKEYREMTLKQALAYALFMYEMDEYEGKQYPVYRVAISSASHPFFTGSTQLIDAEGRVDKFTKRYQNKKTSTLAMKKKEEDAKKKEKTKEKKTRVKKKEK